jgi:hypothetical protein
MSIAAIDPRLWSNLPLILLTVAIVIGVPVAYRLYRQTHEEEEPTPVSDRLWDLEQAYAEGKMSKEEIHRIRELLEGTGGKSTGTAHAKPPRDAPGLSSTTTLEQPPAGEPGGPAPPIDPLAGPS